MSDQVLTSQSDDPCKPPGLVWTCTPSLTSFTASGGVAAASVSTSGGIGVFGVTPPTTQPATPITLANVIALLQAYGLSA